MKDEESWNKLYKHTGWNWMLVWKRQNTLDWPRLKWTSCAEWLIAWNGSRSALCLRRGGSNAPWPSAPWPHYLIRSAPSGKSTQVQEEQETDEMIGEGDKEGEIESLTRNIFHPEWRFITLPQCIAQIVQADSHNAGYHPMPTHTIYSRKRKWLLVIE